MSSIADANGNVTRFEYDERDRLAGIINPLGHTTTYSYDAKGNLISKTNPNGDIINYEYDTVSRLVRKVAPDDTVNYTYDVKDNLVSVSDNDSSLTMNYDASGRLLSVTTGGITQPAVAITYTYDAKGNRVSMTSPVGTTTYTYDSSNRLTYITDPLSKIYSFAFDSLGRKTSLSYPNGVTTSYAYDISSRLTELVTRDPQLATIGSFNYNYDNVGNRTSLSELAGMHNYTYDSLYQLTDAVHPTIPTEQFSYDPVGNRQTDAFGNSYSYNTGNQLLNYDSTGFDYDNNGNMISNTDATGITTYTYDSESRLIRINFSGGGFAEYRYDPFGRRIEKNANGQIMRYVYDKEDILFEYDGGNVLIASYVQNLQIDDPLALEKAGQTYYYHKDALGTITALSDDSGNVAQTYEYDSFGNIVSQTGSIDQPFTYTAREYDLESDLYYYRARYYNAGIGRFISEDPILKLMSSSCSGSDNLSTGFSWSTPSLMSDPQNLNPFVYVGNNPMLWKDPLGLWIDNECMENCKKEYKRRCDLCKEDVCKDKKMPKHACGFCYWASQEFYKKCLADKCQFFGPPPKS